MNLFIKSLTREKKEKGETYMLVDTPVQPSPAVRSRVLGIRHVGAGVKAPRRVLLRPELVAGAKDWPDGVGTVGVSGVVLLYLKNKEKSFSKRVIWNQEMLYRVRLFQGTFSLVFLVLIYSLTSRELPCASFSLSLSCPF